jgi:predicted nucleic acid-binding protein
MKRCLVDVNVWFALIVIQHKHHKLARKWFDRLAADEAGLCRIVQLALIRLLANRSIMGVHVVSASAAWDLLEKLLEDERSAHPCLTTHIE